MKKNYEDDSAENNTRKEVSHFIGNSGAYYHWMKTILTANRQDFFQDVINITDEIVDSGVI